MTKIKCKYCGDILIGDKKGTYIECSCGRCAIDETPHYCRIIGNEDDFQYVDEEMEKYIKVFEYFGYQNQRRKLVEEIHELNDEILMYEEGYGDIEDVTCEMADILNVLKGFMIEYDITADELREKMKAKMERTEKRINSGYYKK